MDIVVFYQRLIRPPHPWRVTKAAVNDPGQRVDLWIEHLPKIPFPCPKCGRSVSVHDHTGERVWRHLDTCDYETWIHARLPRVRCDEHGILQVAPPLSDGRSGLTFQMESRCIDILSECSREGAAGLSGLTWDEVDTVMKRAVSRGLERRGDVVPEAMGIDEKSIFSHHRYFTVISDLAKGRVVDVIDERTMQAVTPWFEARRDLLGNAQKVAMDMSAGYASVVSAMMPDAKICFDHFHVTMTVNQAVDKVRKIEQKTLSDEECRKTFFRSRYLFLYNPENIPSHRAEQFEKLKSVAVKTSRAWAIKEHFRDLWKCQTEADATKFFKKWFWWATHSRLNPVRNAAHTVKRHWRGILNAIIEGVSNACTEGLNNKIEKIKRDAFGFRNKDSFRAAILFHCGKLDLFPRPA
jgi:transposase